MLRMMPPQTNSIILFILLLINVVVSDLNCPADNGTIFTDSDDYTYQLQCGVDLGVSQTTIVYYRTLPFLANCTQTCSDWNLGRPITNCTGITYDSTTRCTLLNGTIDTTYTGDLSAVILIDGPQPQPRAPISFNASCDTDNFRHYIDPDGLTYFTMCGAQNKDVVFSAQLNGIPSFAACIKACSDNRLNPPSDPNAYCYGALYSAEQQVCLMDYAGLGEVDQGGLASAYVVTEAQPCTLNTSVSNVYTTPEDDTSYVYTLYHSDVQVLLSSSTQLTPCGCAEQCSLYNRA